MSSDTNERTRGKKRQTASKSAGKRTKPTTTPDATVLEILGRGRSMTANPARTRTLVAGLKAGIRRHDESEGVQAQELGTQLATLYRSAAHTLFGYEDFVSFARSELGVRSATMYRFLRVAKYATPKQAEWGVLAVLAAGRLIELLRADPAVRRKVGLAKEEPRTINDIAKVPFRLSGGATLRLDAEFVAEADLEALIDELTGTAVKTQDLPLVLRRKNDELETACASDDALSGVDARFAKKRGKQTLRIDIPRGSDVRAVFAALARIVTD